MDTATTLHRIGSSAGSGHARFIGRVGALAVALGIGIAVANSPACLADTGTGTSTPAASADNPSPATKPKAEKPAKKAKNPKRQQDSSATTPGKPGDTDNPKSDTTDQTPAATNPGSDNPAETTNSTTKKSRQNQRRTQAPKPAASVPRPAAATAKTTPKTSPAPTSTAAATAPKPAAAQTPSVESAATTVSSALSAAATNINTLTATTHPVPTAATGGNFVTHVVSSLLGAIGLVPHVGTSPTAPPQAPALWTLFSWIRREIGNTFFNASPIVNYKQTETSQTFGGVIKGDLKATDANADKLTYTVDKGPTKGAVTVRPDGTFTYTPSDALAFTGGTDSFTVTVDDRPGNPFHINLLKLFQPNAGATTTETVTVTVKPTSPLGTADQIALEQKAQAIVNTPQVQAAIEALKQAWLAHAQQRFGLVGGVDAKNLALLDAAAREQALNAAMTVVNNDPDNPLVMAVDMRAHSWYGTDTPGGRFIYDNPDTIYRTIPVRSDSTYVISGKYLGGVPADGNFGVYADISDAKPIGNLLAKDLVVNADGTFTITVDGNPTQPGQTNHIYLPPEAQQIFVRYTMADWNTESAPGITVTRTSGPAGSRAESFDEMVAHTADILANFGTSAHNTALDIVTLNLQTGQLKPPNTLTQPFNFPGTLVSQKQSLGYFQLADNQALVITINPGNAGYFVVPVTNDWELSPGDGTAQTSLNNAQSIANPDGTYTLVISPDDPGAANWVSTGGLNQGTLYIRFQALDATSSAVPMIVSQQVVTLDQLGTVLPAGTKYVTDAERQAQLAARQDGYNGRFGPYPQITTGAQSA
ncbi:Ig-like domain-containing protein [Mycolicibacterium llatzerense]|uniref:Ig-like domain-containing protein n=1 Tax=Mycolicibacterium llatzerense TaxID=280871 RepID=UPI0021B5D0F7|nr:Ig-like domain-containing protein [Mycolicibacterium llatzerense]